tara:strand:- start:106 stop:576 length:471 start_codon:yes stop_codon:yes gene_type:complete
MQNRNNGISEGLFSKSTHIENNTINSIHGATALKLDEQYEVNTSTESLASEEPAVNQNIENRTEMPEGVSIENAAYIENNLEIENSVPQEVEQEITTSPLDRMHTPEVEEYTPQLFSDEQEVIENKEEANNEKLFNQDNNEEEDFEIPAFLRKQKF